ncbi:hypothetical protein DFJ58DRAFT_736702 [Suillus subalutaceus]|uniref:uncharacterized protein n=1 Tax=Suillus subalutaceus TaxID=48586 RepID=UPI001B87DBD1|nr:uncharacterized protein DFJ58DRAFT_736702 [Suillus subalutaceus]KAG1831197.1 hypothetical protein DFJ58DRAFT_736702 [Suillus subalutaceus]
MPSGTKQKPRCNFCLKELSRHKDVTLHIQNTPECRQQWDIAVKAMSSDQSPSQASTLDSSTPPPPDYDYNIPEDVVYDFPSRTRYVPEDAESESGPQSKCTRVEEVADEEPTRFAKVFPHPAADVLGVGKTVFEQIREDQIAMRLEDNPWTPFADEDEWGLGEWLAKRVNKAATDEFLKLGITKSELRSPFSDKSRIIRVTRPT